jgi:hypothetical protein
MKLPLISLLFFLSYLGKSQSTDSLISVLENVHQSIMNQSCAEGQILTNRGMNLFMADRIGYYLSDHENLTFCKNNITLNSANGIFSMTHSFFEPTGADFPVKSFHALGLKTNAFNAFQSATNKQAFSNELGITYKHFWLSKPKVALYNCDEKSFYDTSRELALQKLKGEMEEKGNDFENKLINIQNVTNSVKKQIKLAFYKTLSEEYSRKFAEIQYRDLFETMRFKTIKMHWTNVNFYLPVIRQRFTVAENFTDNFSIKKAYPSEISISHTRFLETQKAAKIYFNIRAGLLANNSINSQILNWTSIETYEKLGGVNSTYLLDKQLDRITIGDFKNFLTPSLSAQFTYFPTENHFGFAASMEQNFGKFKALNGKIGIPIVLIDKQSAPQTNFEIQIRYFDLTNTLNSGRSIKDNVSIGLTLGQTIGRNVY